MIHIDLSHNDSHFFAHSLSVCGFFFFFLLFSPLLHHAKDLVEEPEVSRQTGSSSSSSETRAGWIQEMAAWGGREEEALRLGEETRRR